MLAIKDKKTIISYLLAYSIQEKYPGAKIGDAGLLRDGKFYCDILFTAAQPKNENDLLDLKKNIDKYLVKGCTVTNEEASFDVMLDAFQAFVFSKKIDDLKLEDGVKTTVVKIQLDDKSDKYKTVKLKTSTDLPSKFSDKDININSYKLDSVSTAYWNNDEKNIQLTRISGVIFDDEEELNDYYKKIEEEKNNDHRKLGEDMELFCFDESIGKGLPIWLPNGNIIKEELEKWAKETEDLAGYKRVTTPIMTKENLFITSGHLPMYKDSMYAPMSIDGTDYYIKPMNCPFHHSVFSSKKRTHKELPLKIAEYGWCHRYEDSGSLFGLMRVRGMQMNDAHLYIKKENSIKEFLEVIKLHEYYYKKLGIAKYEMELALRNPENKNKYHGEESDWLEAENLTKSAMEQSGVDFKIVNDGAAFYGPKMDFQIFSSTGRSFTASTNQLDLYMGKKFNLEYIDSDGQIKTPAIIHRAPLGTHERFIGFLLEHFKGVMPCWMSPIQVAIIKIGSEFNEVKVKEVELMFKKFGIRVTLDLKDDSLGKRIHYYKKLNTPFVIVIGDKDVQNKTVSVESRYGKSIINEYELLDFVEKVYAHVSDRKLDSEWM